MKGPILFDVDATVESTRSGRSEFRLQTIQRRSAGETQHEIESGDELRGQVFACVAAQPCQSDRRVDVIKTLYARCLALDPLAHLDSVCRVRADDDDIRLAYLLAESNRQLIKILVQMRRAIRQFRCIAIVRIPRTIAFQERDAVAALIEPFNKRAIGRRVSITP